jgi:hypothetical protein
MAVRAEAMNEHVSLLVTSYETAAFGDAFFGGMVDAEPDDQRREKLRLLQEMVSRAAEWLRPR